MPLYDWSKTSSSNADADPTINWSEGMAPSSVNDSGRAMMTAVAQWRDDISGAITTAGTSTAYTLSSNQGFDTLAHMDNAMIAFIPHATNGASPTINIDGLGGVPIRISPGVSVPSSSLVLGTPYVGTYYNSAGELILHNIISSPYNIPIGGLMPYVGTSAAPNSNFAFPYGQAISRTTYSVLFGLTGTAFGSGDGSTTFNLPDLRGRIPVGKDNMGGSAANRVTTAGSSIDGTTMGAAGGEQTHTLTSTEMPSHTHTATVTDTHTHPVPIGIDNAGGTLGVNKTTQNQSSLANTGLANNGQISVANANTGGGAAHNNMPPSVIVPYIIRII